MIGRGQAGLTILACVVSLVGCANTSNGMVRGFVGGPAWHEKASDAELVSYYAGRPTHFICSRWAKALKHDTSRVIRQRLSMVLAKRGEDPKACDDPADDERQMMLLAAERLSEARQPTFAPFQWSTSKPRDQKDDSQFSPYPSSAVPTWRRDQSIRCETRQSMGISKSYKTTCR